MRNSVSLGLILLLTIFLAVVLGYTGRDDSHITYFVADAVSDGRGIVNYNGERVEQSSSLSFTLLLALFVAATGQLAAALGPFVSASALLAAIGMATAALWNRPWGVSAVVALISPPSLYWALSGMENSLYLALILALVFAIVRERAIVVAALACLVTLTRPEAPFVIVTALFLLSLYKRMIWPGSISAAVGIGSAIVLRIAIGLDLFPNTVAAKMAHGHFGEQLALGMLYFARTLSEMPWTSLCLFLTLGFLATFCTRNFKEKCDPMVALLFSFGAALFAFPVAAGGDWMEAGRFLSAAYPLLLMAALLVALPKMRALLSVVLAVAIVADVFGLAKSAIGGVPLWADVEYLTESFRPATAEGYNRVHLRDISFVDKANPVFEVALSENGHAPLTVASIQAGLVPYYLSRQFGDRIYFVDLLGLSTEHVHDCRDLMSVNFDPYPDILALEDCMGITFDLIYDLEREGRLELIKDMGCDVILTDGYDFDDVTWKQQFVGKQFLADCRDRG